MYIMPTLQLLCACMLTEVVSIKIHAGIDESSLCMYLSSMYAATAQSFIISSYMYVSYFTYITNKLPNSKHKVKYVRSLLLPQSSLTTCMHSYNNRIVVHCTIIEIL